MKVIGITGTLASGKSTVKNFFLSCFSSSSLSLSDIIEEELEKEGKELKRENFIEKGNELRKRYGNQILAEVAILTLSKKIEKEVLIIEGIRNPGEVEFLRKKFGKDFVLIAVDAPREIRFKRLFERKKEGDPKTFEEFLEIDEIDLGNNQPEYGQRVGDCLKLADYLIINDGSINELYKKLEEISKSILSS
ncbi:MAG: AAA family ATPase [Candidatus Aenigmatarchaeota archaeon]|jgi:dephospho-CoA kinase